MNHRLPLVLAIAALVACASTPPPAPPAKRAAPTANAPTPAPRATEKKPASRLEQQIALCKQNDGDACLEASLILGEIGNSDEQDRLAAELELRACELKVAAGCTNYGADLANGLGVKRDDAQAAIYFGKACELGSAFGCTQYAGRLEAGWGIKKDRAKARALFEEACAKDVGLACGKLGDFIVAERRMSERDVAKKAYERACTLGKVRSCWRARQLGSTMTIPPGLAEKELANARALCDDGYGAGCHAAGQFLGLGIGMPRDLVKAMALYQRGCDRGYAASCSSLAALKSRATRRAQLVKDVAGCRVAKRKNRGLCHKSARALLRGEEPGDVAAAIPLLERGCNLRDPDSCQTLGFAHYNQQGVKRDRQRAIVLIRKACQLGRGSACNNAGLILTRDRKAVRQARRLFVRGCKLGDGASCRHMALSLLREDKVKNERKATEFLRRGCKLRDRSACSLRARLKPSAPTSPKAKGPNAPQGDDADDKAKSKAKWACYQTCFAKKDPQLSVKQLRSKCMQSCGLPNDNRKRR